VILGVNLQLLIGPTVPLLAAPEIAEAVQSVSVTHNDEGRSGFQIVLQVGRAGPTDLLDYRLLQHPQLRAFNRVIMVVLFGASPRVLMDGVITNRQFSPGAQPGTATLTLTGEDVSVMMDLKKQRVDHPAQSEALIALKLIGTYAHYGLVPMVVPPFSLDQPLPTERTPAQQGTDLEYLKTMGQRFGYVFYIDPGPLPGANLAYWGPPIRIGLPQRALSVNVGPETNVDSISFTENAMAPTIVRDSVQDRLTNRKLPVVTFIGTRMPPLASKPALPFQLPNVRTALLEQNTGGLNVLQAYARAQGITDKSLDSVVTAQGELNALRYGALLRPRALVGVRGAGFTHDGFYYVKSVSHTIGKGQYKQKFTLTREGSGSTTPAVIP
jgi:hypothetical protein